MRALIGIVTEEDEQEWVSFAESATWRQLWHRAKQVGHERADTSPFRRLSRPYPKWLYDIESEVTERQSGFRFARRAHLEDPWEYCAEEPREARRLDAYALAWDLEESGVAEDGVKRPPRPWPAGVRAARQRYGGRVRARVHALVSERAFSEPGSDSSDVPRRAPLLYEAPRPPAVS